MRMLAVLAALIAHANVTNVPATPDLASQVRNARSAWVGYAVPAIDGYRIDCYRCRLGDDNNNMSFSRRDEDDDLHPAAGNVGVFYRVENGVIANVRVYSIDCPLDGNGTSVTWIDNVAPRNSLALLASLVGGEKPALSRVEGRLSNRALSAVALHAEPSAADRLDEWTRSSASDEVRGEAVFWLAETRPERGLEAARQLIRDTSASRKVRDKAVFALSQIHKPA